MTRFAKFAWFALAYNVVVILWGVFLRASKSGDGCGQHWLTCQGEIIPSAPQLKTVIEFSHRLTSGIAFLVVLVLVIYTFRSFEKRSDVRKTAVGAFLFIISEALVGAGLVLTGNTAETLTAARPFWAIGHLINTFILLAFLTLTAWQATTHRRLGIGRVPSRVLLLFVIGVIAILFVGASGSIAALSSMLFPSQSVAEGIARDFSQGSNMLLRLRVSHPVLSIIASAYLAFFGGWLASKTGDMQVRKWSNLMTVLLLCQIAFGAATLLMLAPIVMQIGHLFLADAIWISFVLMAASVAGSQAVEETS